MRKLLCLLAMAIVSMPLCAQTTYYSIPGATNPNLLSNWNSNRTGTGTSPASFTATGDVFIIQGTGNGTGTPVTMTTTNNWSVGGSGSRLQVENGATLQAFHTITVNAGATFQLDNGATYVHNVASNMTNNIFNGTEILGASSTLRISNWSGNSNVLAGLNESVSFNGMTWYYGNLEINRSGLTSLWAQSISANTNLAAGNVTVSALGANGVFRLIGNSAVTINIGGTLAMTSANGTLQLASANRNSIIATGGYRQTAGTFDFNGGSGGNNLQVSGAYTVSGGTITNSGSGEALLVFNGSNQQAVSVSGNPSYTAGTGQLSVTLNNSAGILLTGSLPVVGNSGAAPAYFTVLAGSVSGTGSVAYSGTGSGGTIGATCLAYSTNASASASAREFPATSGPASLNVNVGSTGTLSFPASFTRSLAGQLILQSGNLAIGSGNTLTLTNSSPSAQLSYTSGFVTSGTLARRLGTSSLPTSLVTGLRYPFGAGSSTDRSVYLFFSGASLSGGSGGDVAITYNSAIGVTTGLNISDNGITLTRRTNLGFTVNTGTFALGTGGQTIGLSALFSNAANVSSLTSLRLTNGSSSFGTLVTASGSTSAPQVGKTGLLITSLNGATLYLGSDNSNSLGTTYTAVGGSVNWGDASAWSTGAVPGAGDDVVIPGGTTLQLQGAVAGPYSCNSISFQGGTGSAVLNATTGQNLSVATTVSSSIASTINLSAGTFTVPSLSGASFTQSGGTFNLSGTLSAGSSASLQFTGGTATLGLLQISGTGTPAVHVNGGTVTVTGATGTGISWTAAGTLQVSSGTLTIGPANGGNRSIALSSGTFSIGGGTVNLNGWFSQTGGSFTQSVGAFTIDGNDGTLAGSVGGSNSLFSVSGGTQTVTGGTITLVDPVFPDAANTGSALRYAVASGNSTWTGNTLVLGNGVSSTAGTSGRGFVLDCFGGTGTGRLVLNNVTLNGNGSTRSAYGPSITNGEVNINGTLTISSGTFFDNTTTGSFNLSGSLVNNGLLSIGRGLNLRNPSGNAGNFTAVTTTQTLSGSGSFESAAGSNNGFIAALLINNSNSTGINLDIALGVNGTLTMTSGRVRLSSANFTLGSTATLSGTPSATNLFAITGTGQFRRVYPSGAGSFTFPVGTFNGTAYNYTPLALNFTANSISRTIGARVLATAHPNLLASPGTLNYIARYWVLTDAQNGTGTYTYNATFTYSTNSPDDLTGNANSLQVSYWNGLTWNPQTSSANNGSVSVSGLTQATGPLQNDWTGRVTAPPTIYYWTGTVSTNWNTNGNWSTNSAPNSAAHNVVIQAATNQPQIPNNSTITVSQLTVASGASITLAGNAALTIHDAVTWSGGGTFAAGSTVSFVSATAAQTIPALNFGNLTLSGAGAKSFAQGTTGIAGTYSVSGATPSYSGSTIQYNGTGAQTIVNAAYHNLSISGSRGTGILTFPAGSLSVWGSFSPTATFSSGGGYDVAAGHTFLFNGNGSQTIPAFSYQNLQVSGARGTDNDVIFGTGTVAVGGTLTLPGDIFSGSGSYRFSGNTLSLGSATGYTLPVLSYHNLSITGTGTFSLGGTTSLSGSYEQTAGTLQVATGSSATRFDIAGSLTLNGGSPVLRLMAGSSAPDAQINVAGSCTLNITTANGTGGIKLEPVSSGGTARLLVGGAFTVPATSVGTALVDFGSGDATGNLVQLSGDFSKAAGSGTFTSSGGSGARGFVFAGTALQSLSYGGSSSEHTSWEILSGSTVQLLSHLPLGSLPNPASSLSVYGTLRTGNFGLSTPASGSASFVLGAGAQLSTAGTNPLPAGISYAFNGSSTVEYNGSGAQTLGGADYGNLLVSGSRGGATLSLGSGTVRVSGNFSWTATNYVQTPGSGTFNYAGNGQTVQALNYNNLTLSGSNVDFGNGTIGIAGTFTPGSATGQNDRVDVDFNGTGAQTIPAFHYSNLTISGTRNGSVTLSSSGIINVAGNFTPSASFSSGSLVSTGSTVRFSGNTDEDIVLPASFHNLEIANTAGVVTLLANATLSGTMTVSGRLALADGAVISGSGSFVLSAGATLEIASAEGITASGNTSSGAIRVSGGKTYSSAANYRYERSGTGAQVTGDGLPATISGTLSIALGAGATQPLTLTRSTTVNQLEISSGILSLGDQNLTVNSASGGSFYSYVRTAGTGAFTIRNVGNSYVNFPVGNTHYNPLQIKNPITLDWSVRVLDEIQNSTAGLQDKLQVAVLRQWDIVPSQNNPVPGGGASIIFTFDVTAPGQVGPSFTTSDNVQAWHYTGGQWNSASTALVPQRLDAGFYNVEVTGLTTFSAYSLTNYRAAALPVTLLRFSGRRTSSGNELKWATAAEQNNRGFAIERSVDGRNFTSVGFVDSRATGGNSSSTLEYSFVDAPATGSRWHYRLRQEDIDGRFKYSPVVLISGDRSAVLSIQGVYPNPLTGGMLQVRLQGGVRAAVVQLQLTDNQGRVVQAERVSVEARSAITHALNLEALPSGVYYLRAYDGDGNVSESVRVVK